MRADARVAVLLVWTAVVLINGGATAEQGADLDGIATINHAFLMDFLEADEGVVALASSGDGEGPPRFADRAQVADVGSGDPAEADSVATTPPALPMTPAPSPAAPSHPGESSDGDTSAESAEELRAEVASLREQISELVGEEKSLRSTTEEEERQRLAAEAEADRWKTVAAQANERAKAEAKRYAEEEARLAQKALDDESARVEALEGKESEWRKRLQQQVRDQQERLQEALEKVQRELQEEKSRESTLQRMVRRWQDEAQSSAALLKELREKEEAEASRASGAEAKEEEEAKQLRQWREAALRVTELVRNETLEEQVGASSYVTAHLQRALEALADTGAPPNATALDAAEALVAAGGASMRFADATNDPAGVSAASPVAFLDSMGKAYARLRQARKEARRSKEVESEQAAKQREQEAMKDPLYRLQHETKELEGSLGHGNASSRGGRGASDKTAKDELSGSVDRVLADSQRALDGKAAGGEDAYASQVLRTPTEQEEQDLLARIDSMDPDLDFKGAAAQLAERELTDQEMAELRQREEAALGDSAEDAERKKRVDIALYGHEWTPTVPPSGEQRV